MRIVMVSGGFDPLHVGHLDLLEAASHFGKVIVALNSDEWLRQKKDYKIMCHADRSRILMSLSMVTAVTPVNDSDGTICEALRHIRPTYFANGGDRNRWDPREHKVCVELGIEELFGIGGKKRRSSRQIIQEALSGRLSTKEIRQ